MVASSGFGFHLVILLVMYGMADKLLRLKAGATANPFIDPAGYQRFLVEEEGKYLKQLEEERAALR